MTSSIDPDRGEPTKKQSPTRCAFSQSVSRSTVPHDLLHLVPSDDLMSGAIRLLPASGDRMPQARASDPCRRYRLRSRGPGTEPDEQSPSQKAPTRETPRPQLILTQSRYRAMEPEVAGLGRKPLETGLQMWLVLGRIGRIDTDLPSRKVAILVLFWTQPGSRVSTS
jgi:hypothetical protein